MSDLDQILELISAVLIGVSGLLMVLAWMEKSLESDQVDSGAGSRRQRRRRADARR